MRRIAKLTVERLSSELSCLKALGALSREEAHELGACLDELKQMLVGISSMTVRGSFGRQGFETELSKFFGIARVLTADLELAYRRLTVTV